MSEIERGFKRAYDLRLEGMPEPPSFAALTVPRAGPRPSLRPVQLVLAYSLGLLVTFVGLFVILRSRAVPEEIDVSADPATAVSESIYESGLGYVLAFDNGYNTLVLLDLADPEKKEFLIEGQRAGDQPYRLHRAGDSLVVGWGEVYSFGLRSLESKSLGAATIFVPAFEDNQVWMVRYGRGAIGSGSVTVWRISTNGDVTVEPTILEEGDLPTLGIPGGLIVDHQGMLALWSQETGEYYEVLSEKTAIAGDVSSRGDIAWCELPCSRIRIRSALGDHDELGASFDFAPLSIHQARFSGDGRFIAVPRVNDVAVYDLDSGESFIAFQNRDVGGDPLIHWAEDGPFLFGTAWTSDTSGNGSVVALNAITREMYAGDRPFGEGGSFVVLSQEDAVSLLEAAVHSCPVTTIDDGEFVPPDPYPAERPGFFWYGSDQLWTLLDQNGHHGPRKSVWWSANFPGGAVEGSPEILVEYRRWGSDAVVKTNEGHGTNAHTLEDGWFMIADIDPDQIGCWEVTASYKGASLSYVFEVE